MGQGSQVTYRLDLTSHIATHRRHHEFQEGHSFGFGQPADDAIVEERSLAIGADEEIAAVQVTVEDAVDHGSLEETHHAGANDLVGIDVFGFQPLEIIELEAVEPLHD